MHMYKRLYFRSLYSIRTHLLSLLLECLVVSKAVCTACVVSVRSPLPPEFGGGGGDTADEDGVDNAPTIVTKARTISDWEPPPVAILKNTCTTHN